MSSPTQCGLCQLVILLLSVEFYTVACLSDTYYIVESSSSPCPGEYIGVPCLTLQQYAANPGRSESVTFLIRPGTYSLSTVLTVSNCNNFTMSSTDVTVRCTSATARFEVNRVENVHISGITFRGCRNGAALQMSRITRVAILNSNFTQNSGSSFKASYSAVTIDKSNFYNNGYNRYADNSAISASYSTILIKNSHFNSNNMGYSDGSAIKTQYSNVTVESSEFSHNTAGSGGAIYMDHSFELRVNCSIFYENRGSSGGAIYVSGNSRHNIIQINNTIMNFNTAHYQGGAIYIVNYGSYWNSRQFQLEIHNTTINSNRADYGDGGAMYIYVQLFNKSLLINDCQFVNNTATQGNGGAIALHEPARKTKTNPSVITKCQFINNTAHNASGGAIFNDGKNTKLVIEKNSFDSNTANAFGGAIYVGGENSSVFVNNANFKKNTAITESGGAIYSNGQHASVILNMSTFHYNSAFSCGVLNVENYTHYSVNLTNSVFTHNTANGQTVGGGVACIVNASINVVNSTFKHNHANHHAGVFYIDESHTIVDGSLFINNSAALDGGVFYTYIHASHYIIRSSHFSKNKAGDDGGVMLIGRLNCYVNIDKTIFDFNSAWDRGGVVAMIASSMFMEINRTNIFNNTAWFGGVISACNSNVTQVGDSLIITKDPLLPFCTLYDETVRQYDFIASQNPYGILSTTPENKHHATEEDTDKVSNMIIIIAVSATAFAGFIIAILITVIAVCICKRSSIKDTLSKMKKVSTSPSLTFCGDSHTSEAPLYNPNSSDEEDNADDV